MCIWRLHAYFQLILIECYIKSERYSNNNNNNSWESIETYKYWPLNGMNWNKTQNELKLITIIIGWNASFNCAFRCIHAIDFSWCWAASYWRLILSDRRLFLHSFDSIWLVIIDGIVRFRLEADLILHRFSFAFSCLHTPNWRIKTAIISICNVILIVNQYEVRRKKQFHCKHCAQIYLFSIQFSYIFPSPIAFYDSMRTSIPKIDCSIYELTLH